MDSKRSKQKLALIFYVAPSEKDLNRHVTDLIKSANLNKKHYSSFAIINMKASSWPNWVLSWKLNASQKEFATTTYIKDYERVLVDKWGLKDHSNDVVLVKDGKVLFVHRGKLSVEKSKELLTILKQEVAKAEQLAHKKVENKKNSNKKSKSLDRNYERFLEPKCHSFRNTPRNNRVSSYLELCSSSLFSKYLNDGKTLPLFIMLLYT